jgi:hypothetical protein
MRLNLHRWIRAISVEVEVLGLLSLSEKLHDRPAEFSCKRGWDAACCDHLVDASIHVPPTGEGDLAVPLLAGLFDSSREWLWKGEIGGRHLYNNLYLVLLIKWVATRHLDALSNPEMVSCGRQQLERRALTSAVLANKANQRSIAVHAEVDLTKVPPSLHDQSGQPHRFAFPPRLPPRSCPDVTVQV